MNMERWGAVALIVASLFYIALMAVHPSHAGGPIIATFSLSGVVHATAMVMKPVFLFGIIVFSRHLGWERPLVLLGLCFYVLAAPFTMLAGTMSGVVFPYMIQAAHTPGADVAAIQPFAQYTTWLNRSFALVHYQLVSIAILLWCIAWPARGALAWIARVVGFISAAGVIGWFLSGTINLEARQGALIVTVAHGLWTLLAAAVLLTTRPKS
jgi:hypothetical protein